ncbi:MAG: GNAT family N-acetyltransferase [Lachnospiraceae bacterium]|nr:GNAT family N-acetyltransferase [Lachnospiraceae bacterium]
MEYIIRGIRESEYPLLASFLYEAVFIPEGKARPPKSIIEKPELQLYISGFGKEDDKCLVAESGNKIVGAAWTRIINDYGHIDDETPSFAMSLYKEYRNMGIGTELVAAMLKLLKDNCYKQVSLSVQKANYAVSMYKKAGFEVVYENEEEYIMVCKL